MSASRILFALGMGVCALTFFLGEESQVTVAGPVFVACMIASSVGVRRATGNRRPWWLFLLALGCFSVGIALRDGHSSDIGAAYASLSIADVPTVAGFLIIITSLFNVVRSRSRRGELAQYADMVLICVAATALYWSFVLHAVLNNPLITTSGQLLTFLYAGFDVGLIALVVRLLVGPGNRNHALRLIAAAASVVVMNDFAVALEIAGQQSVAWIITPISLMAFVWVASAMLHPSLPDVLTPRPQIADRVSRQKAVALGVAGLAPILMLGIRPESSTPLDNTVRLVLALLGGVLLGVRMLSLVRDQERRSQFERDVGAMASNLSTTDSADKVFEETVRAGLDVMGQAAGVSVLSLTEEGNYRVEATSRPSRSRSELIPRAVFPDSLLDQVSLTSGGVDGNGQPAVSASLAVPYEFGGKTAGLVVVDTTKSLVPDQVHAIRKVAQECARGLRAVSHHEDSLQQRSNDRLQTLTANSSTVLMVVDLESRVRFCTSNVEERLGLTDDELIGTDLGDLFPEDGRDIFRDLLTQVIGLDESIEVELAIETRGGARWYQFTLSDHVSEGDIHGVVVAAQDINDRHKSEARVLRSEARFRSLVQRSSDLVAICDEDGILTYLSPACIQILGYEPAELIGTSVLEVMSLSALSDTSELRAQLSSGSVNQQSFEIRTAAKDGTWRHLNVAATNLIDDPAVEGFVLNVRDDTERLSLERTLRHQATHDSLTKLANRAQFNEALADVLSDSSRRAEVIGVMFIDLDDFKTINDGLGHAAGDQVLVAAGDRLRRTVRMNDVVARFGGDEFAILLTNMYGEHEALEMAARILEALSAPLALEGRTLALGASIGLAFDRQRSVEVADLVKQADVAMYASKDKGKGRVSVFNDSMMTTAGGRLDLIDSLRTAIDEGQITVHYQPIVNMKNERIVGFEALARWEHPERGMISPAGFIPVAEETGLIEPLGLGVLRAAAVQLGEWVGNGHDIYVSVNVSVKQLQKPSVVRDLSRAVEESGLAFERVLLEVTESVFVADKDLVADRLAKLRGKGFRVAIDDFGTGYSSLQYLQQFEFDVLKIDKSFVDRLGTDDDTGMVQTVLDLAHRMGATTVAEGIEDAQQAKELRRLKCELGQGYYYARPMSAEKTGAALAAEPLPLRDPADDQLPLELPVVETL